MFVLFIIIIRIYFIFFFLFKAMEALAAPSTAVSPANNIDAPLSPSRQGEVLARQSSHAILQSGSMTMLARSNTQRGTFNLMTKTVQVSESESVSTKTTSKMGAGLLRLDLIGGSFTQTLRKGTAHFFHNIQQLHAEVYFYCICMSVKNVYRFHNLIFVLLHRKSLMLLSSPLQMVSCVDLLIHFL
jgi:hypothetical protein